jgi:hypothetical protein
MGFPGLLLPLAALDAHSVVLITPAVAYVAKFEFARTA